VLSRLKELGFELKPEEVDAFFAKFKCIADRKKEIYDEDLVAMIGKSFTKKNRTGDMLLRIFRFQQVCFLHLWLW
jgi:isopropylmalate/homocitrate/citramalate synthase